MINPEFTPDDERDYADSLMWIALGIDEGDFVDEVDEAFAAGRLGTLARTAARLEIINDHDMRHLDLLIDDDFVAMHLQRVIDDGVYNLSDTEKQIYNGVLRDEKRILQDEQDAADFHLPYI